jgi:sigma-B regulation protein RsbU (phosphoserine phosphatase)
MLTSKDIIQRSIFYVAIIIGLTIVFVGLAILNEKLISTIATHNSQIILIASFVLLLALVFQYKQASISLENAKLYRALQEKQDVLDRDLNMARSVQQGLIPDHIPNIPGFKIAARCLPAESVGGDFYDFIEKEHELNIIIGDVSGHGVSSALVMALTNGIINEISREKDTPAQILLDVNKHVQRYLANNINFVTVFFARLDKTGRKLHYSNAGHLPALLFKKNAKKPVPLASEGILLGVFSDAQFSESVLELESGDKVIFYTDGLVELRNSQGEWYGEERMIELITHNKALGAQELLETIFTSVDKFSALQRDDKTLVVLDLTYVRSWKKYFIFFLERHRDKFYLLCLLWSVNA